MTRSAWDLQNKGGDFGDRSSDERPAPSGTVPADHRREQSLRKSEERYRRVTENIQVALLVLEDGNTVYVNDGACELFGYSREALMTMKLPDEVAAPEERPRLEELANRAENASLVSTQGEFWVVRPDGSRRSVNSRYSIHRTDSCTTQYVVVTDITERKLAEEALRRSEAKSKALLEAIPDLMFRMTAQGEVLEFYAPFDRMLYAPREGILGRMLTDLVPPDVAQGGIECAQRALASTTPESFEYQLDLSSGVGYFEARMVASGDSEVLAIIRDITDRKLAEQALRESESRHRLLMQQASDAILITDGNGRFIEVNPRGCELLGYEEQELLALSISDLVPEANRATVPERFAELRDARPLLLERQLRHKSGEYIDVEVSAKAIGDGRIQGIARDITKRRRAEDALRRSEESFRTLIEQTPDLIIVHRRGSIVYVNERGAAFLGYRSAEELLGTSALDLVHVDDRAMVEARIRDQLTTGRPVVPLEERLIRGDGSVVHAEVAAIPLDFQGVPSIIVVAHDLTERRKAEEERSRFEAQIQHSQKLESLGVLAGGIAHDFNNLLMGVLGNAGLALGALDESTSAYPSVKRIEKAARRAAELTQQLLAYSGKGKFVTEPVNLSELAEEMVHLLETVVSNRADLRCELASDLPSIDADPTQLRQVVMNLITNASDAVGDRMGTIVVKTGFVDVDDAYLADSVFHGASPRGCCVFVEVSDSGCGMDPERVPKIFDPFFTTKFAGRGLGLAAVLGIVRGHRGAIKVRSGLGQGTTFTVVFPASRPSLSPPATSPATTPSFVVHGTALIVDDDEDVRSVTAIVFEQLGLTVHTAADGYEGLQLLRAHGDEVVLVLLDLTMPRMSGEEALRQMQEMRPNLPVILSSGYAEPQQLRRLIGEASGGVGFIQKPYGPSELIEAVRTTLKLE